MTETREQMAARHAAERAALEARESEPDWPLVLRQMAYVWKSVANGDDQSHIGLKYEAVCRDLADRIAALPLAPIPAPAMGEVRITEEQGAALHKAMLESLDDLAMPIVPVAAWPGEAEIVDMATEVAIDIRRKPGGHKFDEAALEMARRLRDHMTGASS